MCELPQLTHGQFIEVLGEFGSLCTSRINFDVHCDSLRGIIFDTAHALITNKLKFFLDGEIVYALLFKLLITCLKWLVIIYTKQHAQNIGKISKV